MKGLGGRHWKTRVARPVSPSSGRRRLIKSEEELMVMVLEMEENRPSSNSRQGDGP